MTQPFSWRKYGRYVLTGLCFMYAFKTVDWALSSTSVVKRLERANLDALFSGKPLEVSKEIFLVTVTDEDYRQLFAGVSPLQPEKLKEIISAILESGPKVLGVDFDTSGWKDVDVPRHDATTIVWARELITTAGKTELGGGFNGGGKSDCYGVPAYVPDDDSVIREYSEYALGSDQVYPTVPVNLAAAFLKGPGACVPEKPLAKWKKPKHLPLINYAGDARAFNRLSAGALLQLKGNSESWNRWRTSNPLKDKIVLLGGSYRAARDAYPTPVGYLDGVVILAQTAQTRLPGHELRSDTPEGLLHSWFSIQGFVLLLGGYFIPKGWRLAVTILTGPVDAFFGNWIWFYAGGTFLSFVPYLVGLTVHQIYDHIKDYRKLTKENRDLKDRLRASGLAVPEADADDD